MKSLLFFIFVLLNYLNPISPIVTVVFDFLILIVCSNRSPVNNRLLSVVFGYCCIIWVWTLCVMMLNQRFDTYVFIKYLRMPIMVQLIYYCIASLEFKTETLIRTLYILCFANIVAIWSELYIPGIRDIIAQILNISRLESASHFDNRVIGIGGSFEGCSIMCILLMVMSYERYKHKETIYDLAVIFIAFVSMIYVSRTGMLIGAVILLYLMIGLYRTSSSYHKVFVGFFSSSVVFIAVAIMLPILINTSGLFENDYTTNYALDLGTDYGTGTAGELTRGSHLNILKKPIEDLIIGYGINSENFKGMNISTDIGYLEFICHIGIIGLLLVMLLHLYVLRFLYRKNKKLRIKPNSEGLVHINNITILYLIILFMFNYKLMLLYSRGTFELLLILLFASEKLVPKKIIYAKQL